MTDSGGELITECMILACLKKKTNTDQTARNVFQVIYFTYFTVKPETLFSKSC